MRVARTTGLVLAALLPCAGWARPTVRDEGPRVVVEGVRYRAAFVRDTLDWSLELKAADGARFPVTKRADAVTFGVMRGPDELTGSGLRATHAVATTAGAVVVGRQAVLDPMAGLTVAQHFVCLDDGIAMGCSLSGEGADRPGATMWWPPRMLLVAGEFDGYEFRAGDGKLHAGQISALAPMPAYAGVSPWGPQGDTVASLDPRRPSLLVRAGKRGVCLGVVYARFAEDWKGASAFVQRYAADSLYLYAGLAPTPATATRWAWVGPLDGLEPGAVDRVLQQTAAAIDAFKPIAPAPPASMSATLPDFPAELRRPAPLADIRQAAVFSVNEGRGGSEYDLSLARKVGSDLLIRAWFKWAQAPPVRDWTNQPQLAHRFGALFGGGITCSALYDGENGLTREQVLDMATRDPAGNLVDAWDSPGVRHGSLSSPAYRDYLFRWCREQIDAGVDCLFMDEHTAALSEKEGYDDHSLADFREFLTTACSRTRGWSLDDARWRTELGVDLADPEVCPNGRMDSFGYRAHLRKVGAVANTAVEANRLFGLWGEFRSWRDDRAWHGLTDRIRAYAKSLGRTVLISANGIARYVDLQVLGVWDRWTTDRGHVDLRANLIPAWRAQVVAGHDAAGADVPVVFFHDWGFGDTPFPWMAVPASEREVWMRTRGAEIYAAGGFFAFPVLGPFGCDAGRDGTLPLIAKLTAFYQRNRALYLGARWLGGECVRTSAPLISASATWQAAGKTLVVHAINRDARAGVLQRRGPVTLRLAAGRAPISATMVSPDFEGARPVTVRLSGKHLVVTLPALDAYTVVRLKVAREPDLAALKDVARVRPGMSWRRPPSSDFEVLPDCSVRRAGDLEGFLQGMLHTEMRNPPTFRVNALAPARLLVHVRAVAMAGARLVVSVDGKAAKTIDLPDRDGKNDGMAAEYDAAYTISIPAGKHRVTVDNTGGDWATIEWYQFAGRLGRW